jgi:hypothetical protein
MIPRDFKPLVSLFRMSKLNSAIYYCSRKATEGRDDKTLKLVHRHSTSWFCPFELHLEELLLVTQISEHFMLSLVP